MSKKTNEVEPTEENTAPEVAPVEPVATNLIAVNLKRDFWDADGVRVRAPQVVEVPIDDALSMIQSGAATKVD